MLDNKPLFSYLKSENPNHPTMNPKKEISPQNRREFLLKTLSSCALCCIAAPNLLAAAVRMNDPKNATEDKFLNASGMTCKDVFNFAYRDNYIPAMKNLSLIAGKEKLLEMLKESSSMVNPAIIKYWETTYPEKSLGNWIADIEVSLNSELYKNALTFEIFNKTDTSVEMKVTECLWAQTFREADAAEIGFAGICYADYATTKAFNPKMKFIRSKTLMEGGDCCQSQYEMEG
jgi:hypothetical protein